MSGILEQMQGAIQALQSEVATIKAILASAQPAPVATAAFTQPVPADPFGLPAAAAPAVSAITEEMIMNFVRQHVEDPNKKAALTAEMHAMGIQQLPMAQEHQYAELYQRFQNAMSRFGGNGTIPGAGQAPAGATTSIV